MHPAEIDLDDVILGSVAAPESRRLFISAEFAASDLGSTTTRRCVPHDAMLLGGHVLRANLPRLPRHLLLSVDSGDRGKRGPRQWPQASAGCDQLPIFSRHLGGRLIDRFRSILLAPTRTEDQWDERCSAKSSPNSKLPRLFRKLRSRFSERPPSSPDSSWRPASAYLIAAFTAAKARSAKCPSAPFCVL
jgi:hypothetical protein